MDVVIYIKKGIEIKTLIKLYKQIRDPVVWKQVEDAAQGLL